MSQLEEPQIILGHRRNGLLLAYKGYVYQKNRTKSNKFFWRCADPSCDVYIQTLVFNVQVGARVPLMNEPRLHSHITNDDIIGRQTAVHNMIEFVRADPCAPVRNAYQ